MLPLSALTALHNKCVYSCIYIDDRAQIQILKFILIA